MRSTPALLAVALLLAACGTDTPSAGPTDSDAASAVDTGATAGLADTEADAGQQADSAEADDTAVPDTAVPDTAAPDTVAPDTVAPDTVAPDTVAPDTVAPDTVAPDTVLPDAGTPDTGSPDTSTPDTVTPDTGSADTVTPDTVTPDTGTPDTGTPDTGSADTVTPDTGPADAGCPGPAACPQPSDPCLVATCGAGVCGVGPATNGLACDADGSVCTVGDACSKGACTKGKPKTCDDANACTTDSCHKSKGCQHTASSAPCSDGDSCTIGDVCKASACTAGKAKACSDGHPCTADSCDSKTGACTFKPQPACPACSATFSDGRLIHGDAPPLVKVDPKCGRLSYGRYKGQGESKAQHLLPDFSWAGYMGGGVAIPTVKVVKTLSPKSGDNRAQIQAALDAVAKLPLDKSGHRGAVLLKKGTYSVGDTLFIKASGVVLRGQGQGASGTVLKATKKAQHDLIHLKGGGSGWKLVSGTKTAITSGFVPVGTRTFTVASTAKLKPGMTIAVRRTPSSKWIDLLGMGKYGWTASKYAINHERRIVALSGKTVTVDIPLVDAIDKAYGGGEVFGVDFTSRITQVGVEDLRLVSAYASATDEKHGWNAVKLSRVANSWVRRVTAQHFGMSAVTIHSESAFNTVEEVAQLDPKSQITGGRRYSFNVTDGIGNLFQRCFAREGRHNFVTSSGVTGPNVWLDSLSDKNHSDEGPHHRWATGALFDSCMSKTFNVQNRKTSGTGHGWAGAQTLFWNLIATSELRCDAPKRSMNWAVGCVGTKKQGIWAPEEPYGLFESHGKAVAAIRSLYLAQLEDRLGSKAVAAVAIPQQSGRIWNQLYGWQGKAALSATIKAAPKACTSGVFAGKACCAASCGVCGGSGCSQRPGGASACCGGPITSAKKTCGKHPPPCTIP